MPQSPGIQAELKLHPDVHSLDDEWSGITDPVIRRKLQNRLNQRAARRRKAEHRKAGVADAPASSGSTGAAALKNVPLNERIDLNDLVALRRKKITNSEWYTASEAFNPSTQSAFVSIRSKNSCQRWYEILLEHRVVNIKELAEKLDKNQLDACMFPLSGDHLISLVYYNVYRALISNVKLLGLDLNLMYSDDYPSPFLPLSPSANSRIRNLPPSLQPTELQKTMAHHPVWDIFPNPEIRDNILRYGEENIDDTQLCIDMVGDGNYNNVPQGDSQQTNGLIVWSEPWDPEGWEATESFIRKWPFLLKGAKKAQAATNKWRIQRGEEPLDFDRILEIE